MELLALYSHPDNDKSHLQATAAAEKVRQRSDEDSTGTVPGSRSTLVGEFFAAPIKERAIAFELLPAPCMAALIIRCGLQ